MSECSVLSPIFLGVCIAQAFTEMHREIKRERERGQTTHGETHLAGDRRLDSSSVELTVALRQVSVTHREQPTCHSNRVVHCGAHTDPSVVDVAAIGLCV